MEPGRAVSISGRQANRVVRDCRHRPISWPASAAEHHCRQMAVVPICQQARRLLPMLLQGCLPERLGLASGHRARSETSNRPIGKKQADEATRLGFEPRQREPKSLVLPLHHRVSLAEYSEIAQPLRRLRMAVVWPAPAKSSGGLISANQSLAVTTDDGSIPRSSKRRLRRIGSSVLGRFRPKHA